ncbi:MAG TPA: acyl-CoA dehydrogenase family protein [Acidimicrobiia bacterium]|nr:acyl-CoA dehydrogenase family protein [Acidimicrobiia bacterium]
MQPTLPLPPEADRYRADVRAFLAEHAPDGRYPADFVRALARAGFVAPHWPRPWGLDAGPLQQLAIDDELRRAHAPRPLNPIGIGWAGPALLVAGTPAQHAHWLPGILDGSEFWCQLFSEPGAGSDLASLTTRANRDGDEWVVQGQKIWTTAAQHARWGILLARTNPDAEAHQGISYFVLDMRAPGIEVRPIRQMDGSSGFNEVFLDDVRIPADHLVGEEHDGWRLARVTLGNERVSLSGEGALWGMGPTAHDLVAIVREHGGVRDPVVRQRVAAVYAEAEVLRLIRMRTLAARLRGLEPGPEASVRKAIADEHGQRVMALAVELAGAHGLLADRGPFGTETATWANGYLFSRALTIGGGTAEVQRNIIAEKGLGLPRD